MGLLEKVAIGLAKKATKHVAVDVITGKNKTANNIKQSFENSRTEKIHKTAADRIIFSMDHFTLNGESVINGPDGEKKYYIEKTPSGKEIKIQDNENNIICKITGSETSAKIKCGRKKIGEVNSNFSFKGTYYTTTINNWKITSDLLGFKYTFSDHERLIAETDTKCWGGKRCYFYLNNYDDIENVLFIHSAISVILAYSIENTIERSEKKDRIDSKKEKKEDAEQRKKKKLENKEAEKKKARKKRYVDVYEPIPLEDDDE